MPRPISGAVLALLKRKPKPTPGVRAIGVFAILVEKKIILLVRAKGRKFWSLPGGKLKAREKIVDGLRREVREECGCEITAIKSSGLILREDRKYLGLVFTARIKKTRKLSKKSEIAEAQWFPLAKLPKLGPQAAGLLRGKLRAGVKVL
jgi:ADP-ribose pyrophosphatase YjhB (NUDIX family)